MKTVAFLIGGAFGFLVAAARLNDYQVIHDMLRLREPDVFLLMGSAVGVAAPTLVFLQRRRWQTPFAGEMAVLRQPITRRAVFGAAIFGTGWAVAGTCPVPALAMAANGSGLGVVVATGLFGGIALRDTIDRRRNIEPPEGC